MNRGGTLGSRHCHCMLQLPAFTQRLSKFYFLPHTVSEPLQWTQPEWPASHKKPFRGKLNDLETRPSKAFKGLFERSREFRLSGCCISGWPGRPGGKTSRFWRKPTALCCLVVFFFHCFTLRHYFCKQKELVEKCIQDFMYLVLSSAKQKLPPWYKFQRWYSFSELSYLLDRFFWSNFWWNLSQAVI